MSRDSENLMLYVYSPMSTWPYTSLVCENHSIYVYSLSDVLVRLYSRYSLPHPRTK